MICAIYDMPRISCYFQKLYINKDANGQDAVEYSANSITQCLLIILKISQPEMK